MINDFKSLKPNGNYLTAPKLCRYGRKNENTPQLEIFKAAFNFFVFS